jgi:hypothetical protein
VHHPDHQQRKQRQAEWLAGDEVVIAQVLRTNGDARLAGRRPWAV